MISLDQAKEIGIPLAITPDGSFEGNVIFGQSGILLNVFHDAKNDLSEIILTAAGKQPKFIPLCLTDKSVEELATLIKILEPVMLWDYELNTERK